MKFIFERNMMETLNRILCDKNDISVLKSFGAKDLSEDDKKNFIELGILAPEGNIKSDIKSGLQLLAKPNAVVKIMFSGGVGRFDYSVSYDKSFQKRISFTTTPNTVTIDDELEVKDVLEAFEEFVGKSSLKSVRFNNKFDKVEALVLGAMLDIERKATLRAFADELPYNRGLYNSNLVWRMINSTGPSIQWLVYCINEIIGEKISLNQKQIQDALNHLSENGIIIKHDNQYQLSTDLCVLANRMIIIDNIITVEALSINDDNEIVGTGFTCMQSGIHDLLMMDYDGEKISFETINSLLLLKYMERFLNGEAFYSKLSKPNF